MDKSQIVSGFDSMIDVAHKQFKNAGVSLCVVACHRLPNFYLEFGMKVGRGVDEAHIQRFFEELRRLAYSGKAATSFKASGSAAPYGQWSSWVRREECRVKETIVVVRSPDDQLSYDECILVAGALKSKFLIPSLRVRFEVGPLTITLRA